VSTSKKKQDQEIKVPKNLEVLSTPELRLLLGKLNGLKSHLDYERVQAEYHRRELKSLNTLKFGVLCVKFKHLTEHPDYERVQAEHRRREEAAATKADISTSFALEFSCKWA
jgi:hypothetical protein